MLSEHNDKQQGAYDEQCERIYHEIDARMTILIVLDGKKGHGFSVCCNIEDKHIVETIPKLLRELADMIEKEQGNEDVFHKL